MMYAERNNDSEMIKLLRRHMWVPILDNVIPDVISDIDGGNIQKKSSNLSRFEKETSISPKRKTRCVENEKRIINLSSISADC